MGISENARVEQQPTRMGAACLVALAVGILAVTGCGEPQATVVPTEGDVFYNDKPLESGQITLIPKTGPIARGEIGPDGSFVLSTHEEGDGAVLGTHRVRVTCYEPAEPGEGVDPMLEEVGLGKSLIPTKYTNQDTSGLEEEVTDPPKRLRIDLVDP